MIVIQNLSFDQDFVFRWSKSLSKLFPDNFSLPWIIYSSSFWKLFNYLLFFCQFPTIIFFSFFLKLIISLFFGVATNKWFVYYQLNGFKHTRRMYQNCVFWWSWSTMQSTYIFNLSSQPHRVIEPPHVASISHL